ncbi:MAG: putative holliday junction resolvase [Parcubacteria group bacterium Gr01-1014_48]|nr:MAG: putative holliday junction resolvase [Parcubacteria group bacterium Greene0416_14]TSC73858.1 MAG: putative holliday junction resolvase [Parcubacteria group bacterium Gr01-1014_48]TSD00411.1 MAG: putative holliday junction resolvase [Parcubacteria group bacterium Greene1014_15]TSD07524.1 MAG: putative holliday junction resolvase [Parcubacteria group bacterium Greene0714_4]
MKVMGIDFGSKRVGVALSDENALFAFPHSVMKNDDTLLENVLALARSEGVRKIVMGESKNYKGSPNVIMKEVEAFKERLLKEGNIEVVFEPEFLTSAEAERIQGKHDTLDASAAALILKSYLDRVKN